MQITWHKNHPQCKEKQSQRVSMYRALLRFLIQPVGKSAITSGYFSCFHHTTVFSPLWHCPTAPIPINSSLSALTGSDPGILEDANTAPHQGPCLLAITTPPSALGTALQFANSLCWAGLPQKSTLTPFFPAFPPFWQRESIIPKWKAPKDSFKVKTNIQPLKTQLSRVFLLKEVISLETKTFYFRIFQLALGSRTTTKKSGKHN